MSTNPLNDITRIYLEQVVESSHLETDMKKRREDNEEAIEDMKKTKAHKDMSKAARKALGIDEMVKGADPEMRKAAAAERKAGDKPLSPSAGKQNADKMERDIKYMDKVTKKNKNVVGLVTKEAMDPVGQEDADIDNDGDTDKSDKYLHKRRKAIGKAIANKKSVKEGYSNWRQDLSEVIKDVEPKKISEKKVNNASLIKINPKLGEAVEEIGGTLLEMVEMDEFDYVVESAYIELLDEGYGEDEIEEALDYALTEAKVTFGHDTSGADKKKEGLLSVARKKLSGAKAAAKKSIASGARKVAKGAVAVARKMESGDKKPHTAARKPATYRGAGAGQKEKVSSGSYKGPEKKKAEPVSDPWEGSYKKSSEVKAKKTKAPAKAKPVAAKTPAKKKRASKLDSLLSDIRNEEAKPFPFKKVEAQKEKARKGSVYGKPMKNEPAPKISDKEKSETGRFTKMQFAYDKAKRAKQEADKARRSSTFYKDTHPTSAPKMKKANEEVQLDEKTLSKKEMSKREEIVKSMKKRAGDFEKRYPGRGKEVMYATATKMAKKVAEQVQDEPTTPTAPVLGKMDKKKEMLDRQRLANLRTLEMKKRQLRNQTLQMQKQGKLPLEAT